MAQFSETTMVRITPDLRNASQSLAQQKEISEGAVVQLALRKLLKEKVTDAKEVRRRKVQTQQRKKVDVLAKSGWRGSQA